MRPFLILALSLLTLSCDAQSADVPGGKKKKGGKKSKEVVAVTGLTRMGTMRGVRESSGLALAGTTGAFYTHGDQGNPPVLYKVNPQGEVLAKLDVPGADAVDWECLAQDDQGHIFIGDVGNNANNRQNLTIYRFDPGKPSTAAARLRFRYADQQEFPPADKGARNFDCEALLWHKGTLYLFTRDRGRHRTCRIYALPAEPGEGTARPVGAYELPGEISGADLSPDGRQLALVGHGRLHLIDLPQPGQLTGGTARSIGLPGAGQTEGVAYLDARTLLITAEEGTIFHYDLAATPGS